MRRLPMPFTRGGAPVSAMPPMGGAMVQPPMRPNMAAPHANMGAVLFRRRVGMPPQGMAMGKTKVIKCAKGSSHITAAQRKRLPSSSFALPGQGTGKSGKGPGSYPIDTAARARNALARGAQHASSSQLAQIRRKVHAKYPGIKIGGK